MAKERKARMGDGRKTPPVCKICWCGIYYEDDTVWVTSPDPGLAHLVCVEPPPPTPPPPKC